MPPVTGEERLDERDRAKNRRNLVVGGAAAALVLAGSGLAVVAGAGKQDAEDQRDQAAGQVVSLAQQIQAECRAGRLRGPICENAARAKNDPVPGPQDEPVTPEPPTAEAVAAAVASYLTANPPPAGPGPTRAQITAAVTAELLANPPPAGRPPTETEIASAVADYLAANPPPSGEPGRPPTSGEIAAAVAAYLEENPPERGPQGEPGDAGAPGAPGVGVADVAGPARNGDGVCQVVFVLTDGSRRPITVPDEFCGPTPTPPTSEPEGTS